MAIMIKCECEAVYEQTEIETTDWIERSADCQVCGHPLKSWRGQKLLCFDLIENPTE